MRGREKLCVIMAFRSSMMENEEELGVMCDWWKNSHCETHSESE